MSRVVELRTLRASVPLTRTFATAQRSTDRLDVLLVRALDSDGRAGWGEVAMSWRVTGEGTAGATAVVEGPLRDAVVGMPLDEPGTWGSAIAGAVVRNPAARSAVDAAVWDLHAQQLGAPLHRVLATGSTDRVRTDMTLAVDDAERVVETARIHVDDGFRTLKVKLGTDPEHDDRVVRALRRGPAAHVALRVDANQGWTADAAIRLVRGWEDDGLGIELVEQPTPADDLEALARVRAAVATPILADESVWDARQLRELVRIGAADLVGVKLAKAGGVTAALELIELATASGVGVLLGCMLESTVGVTAAAHVAAGLPGRAHDLDAAHWLRDSPVRGGARPRADELELAAAPGLGIDGWAA